MLAPILIQDSDEANYPRNFSGCFDQPGLANEFHTAFFANPRVRAITGFVRLDRSMYQNQIADALVVLRRVKAQFESSGYEVETLRLTTQPLADLVAGMSEDQALAFLTQLDELSVKQNFLPNVGPAMLHDSDDPATMHLLERVLSTLPNIEASTIIADESGNPLENDSPHRGTGEVRHRSQSTEPGKLQLHGHRHAKAIRTVLPWFVSHRRG